jgi:hypothetical protein
LRSASTFLKKKDEKKRKKKEKEKEKEKKKLLAGFLAQPCPPGR